MKHSIFYSLSTPVKWILSWVSFTEGTSTVKMNKADTSQSTIFEKCSRSSCNHLVDTLLDMAVWLFQKGLTEVGRITLSVQHHPQPAI